MKLRSALKGATAPIALCVAFIATPVLAQDGDAEIVLTEEDEAAEAAPTSDVIFVTGSRIRRNEFTSASPLTVIDPALAARAGLMDTGEMVQGSPIAAGSSQITSAISSNFVTNGGTGAQTVSLRGLGAERTLVLLNGRRAGPAGTRGAVSAFDLNVLPQSIVGQVDILKDGASSIYGSDAVAGVVNLITKTDTEGVEFDLFGSTPFASGGESFSASATWGKTFDRGHILVAANYYRRNELSRGDRSYLQCGESFVYTDDTYETRADLIDPRTGEYACNGAEGNNTWGHVWTYDYSYYYSPNGSNIPGSDGDGVAQLLQYSYPGHDLGQYIPAVSAPLDGGQISVPEGWYNVGYDAASRSVYNNYHPGMNADSIIPETDRYTIYLDASYELFDGVELYSELLYNKRKNYVNGSRQVWQFGFGNPTGGLFGFPDAGDPRANGFGGPALFSPTAYTDQGDSSVEVDYYRAVVGLRGDINSSWGYDIYGQYSKSDASYSNQQVLQDSIDAQDFRGVFVPADCTGTVTPVGGKDCVNVDWYSPRVMYGNLTPAEQEFLFEWETGNTEYTQSYVEAIVSGDLFELPGGTMGLAVGATFRRDEIDDTPGAITQARNAWQATGAGRTAGKSDTLEAFGEINVPLLSDLPFIEALTFTGAGRVTNVKATRLSDGATDSRKGNFTYKLGADWEVTDWLRLRGTYGTSFRAPALFEQFLDDQTASLSQRSIDPCIQWGIAIDRSEISQRLADNCAADGVPRNHGGGGINATTITGGGLGVLESETSKAWTASVVLTPTFDFLPDTSFSLAVDYFDIEVNGEIAQIGAGNILNLCYDSDDYPNDALCTLFARNDDVGDLTNGSPSNVNFIRDSYININSQQNRGVDVTARITHDFPGDVSLTVQGQMTWQTKDTLILLDTNTIDLNNEAGEPKFVGDFRAILDAGPWSFFYQVDVIGSSDGDVDDYVARNGPGLNDDLCYQFVTYNNPVCYDLNMPTVFYHSASITREFAEHFTVTAGVSNLFDTRPPTPSNVGDNGINHLGNGVLYSQYDLLGRRAFINFNVKY